jgi:membrane fusion protein, multidrug efflux system
MPPDAAAPLAEPRPAARPASRRGLLIAAVIALALAAFVVVSGILGRAHQSQATRSWTDAQAAPTVSVVSATSRGGARSLVLPGQLQAWYNAPIYSRVSGYVRSWTQDIGAHVRRGELLATIDTPETDQQIIQARADLATAEANANLAGTTAQRWARLLKQDAVSAQESDEKAGDFAARTAMVKAAQANLDRLLALKGFSRITAPFDGVITARRTDIGALVNAGAGATPNSELFDVAEVDKLRLYVETPQASSAEMRPGVAASFTVPEWPGDTFHARVATTSNAISDRSGTLQTELVVDNTGGRLKPGDYAQVKFATAGAQADSDVLTLPSSALLFRSAGAEAAVLDDSGHVHLRPIQVGRNFGGSMQVLSGLKPGERVVNNPPDSLADGERVRVTDQRSGG